MENIDTQTEDYSGQTLWDNSGIASDSSYIRHTIYTHDTYFDGFSYVKKLDRAEKYSLPKDVLKNEDLVLFLHFAVSKKIDNNGYRKIVQSAAVASSEQLVKTGGSPSNKKIIPLTYNSKFKFIVPNTFTSALDDRIETIHSLATKAENVFYLSISKQWIGILFRAKNNFANMLFSTLWTPYMFFSDLSEKFKTDSLEVGFHDSHVLKKIVIQKTNQSGREMEKSLEVLSSLSTSFGTLPASTSFLLSLVGSGYFLTHYYFQVDPLHLIPFVKKYARDQVGVIFIFTFGVFCYVSIKHWRAGLLYLIVFLSNFFLSLSEKVQTTGIRLDKDFKSSF